MSYPHSIPPTVQIRRTQLVGLIVAVAALAAAVTLTVSSLAFDDGTTSSTASSASRPASSVAQNARRVPSMPVTGAQVAALASIGMQPSRYIDAIMSLTPAQLPAGALGTGYAPATDQGGLTVKSVLASMSPQTRRYTERIMNLTFEQLAAGAAGHP
jgi:predicted metal-binding membrane protein